MSRLYKKAGIENLKMHISMENQTPISKEQVDILKEFNTMLNKLSDACSDNNFNDVMGELGFFTMSIDEAAAELSDVIELMDFFQ